MTCDLDLEALFIYIYIKKTNWVDQPDACRHQGCRRRGGSDRLQSGVCAQPAPTWPGGGGGQRCLPHLHTRGTQAHSNR